MDIALRNFRMELLRRRVAYRHLRSMEFATPEALQKYLKNHPNADPSLHSVKDSGKDGDQEEVSLADRIKKMPAQVKAYLKEAPEAVKKFVEDKEYRKQVVVGAKDSIKNLPRRTFEHARDAVVTEVEGFKTACDGVKTFLKGGKLTPEHKEAIKAVALDVAVTVAVVAVTEGLGAGLRGVARASAESFSTGLAKKLAYKSLTPKAGIVTTLQDYKALGQGLWQRAQQFLVRTADDLDERDLVVAYVMATVSKQLDDISDDDLMDALQEASNQQD